MLTEVRNNGNCFLVMSRVKDYQLLTKLIQHVILLFARYIPRFCLVPIEDGFEGAGRMWGWRKDHHKM